MACRVFHYRGDALNWKQDYEGQWPDRYDLVAIVDTNYTEDAYRLTNHIDDAWWNNAAVTHVGVAKNQRSTSTGVSTPNRPPWSAINSQSPRSSSL